MNFEPETLNQLDEISRNEVDRTLLRYEDARYQVEKRLLKIGALNDTKTYAAFNDILNDFPPYKELKRFKAIAKQLREENCND